ncbi:MAG: hypothetical protein ACE5G2_13370, partial [Candidatus Krumholzibacteriia bacterium]
MVVRLYRDEMPVGLDGLAAVPAGSFFQTTVWLRALHLAEPRYRPWVVAAEDADGSLLGACPLVAVRRFGMVRLYAGALGTYGGIVAHSASAAAAVWGELEHLARSARVLLVRIHDFATSLEGSGAASPAWRREPETCQVLDLADDPQELFRGALTSRNRNKIRKAEKLGVRVRRARDPAALGRYAQLYRESAARWGLKRRLPEALFHALAE